MLYELQILRNNKPCKDKAEAIQNLDNFAKHLIGQPCCILYNDEGAVKVLLAIGKKNYDEEGYEVPSGENYEIINNFIDNTLYWQKLNEDIDALINTQDKVKFAFMDIDDFDAWKAKISVPGNLISFVDSENGVRTIYKGDQTYATNNILELVAGEDVKDLDIKEGDTFTDIIYKLKDYFSTKSLLWNDSKVFNLYEATHGEWKDINRDMPVDERSFFEVDLSPAYPSAKVKAYYVNKELIGNAYISYIDNLNKQMPYNVGEFWNGFTLADVYKMSGHDINVIIDKILFPEKLRLNYGIITEEQIRSLFDGTAGPYDPSEDDDEHEHSSDHVLISKPDIDDIIEAIKHGEIDPYDPSIKGVIFDLIEPDEVDEIIKNLKENK